MKYAIVEKGGKQYKVTEGSTIDVDLFSAEIGDKVSLERVLLIADGDKINIGNPTVNGAQVKTTVIAHVKGPKIVVFKYRPRNRYRVKTGHRQKYIRLQIDSITLNGKKQAKKRGKMAHKKGGGSSRNGRDSNSQRLGVKKFGGEHVLSGNIIVRQRGTPIKPGRNVGRGKDDTLFATIEGFVVYENIRDNRKRVTVVPLPELVSA